MIFKYGTYTHAQNEVALTTTQRAVFSPRGFRQATRHTWNLVGVLQANSQAELLTKIGLLQAAYQTNGQDAGLFLDDAITPTHLQLVSNNTLGGVRVISGPQFPSADGAELSTFVSYQVRLEADIADTSETLLAFQETVNFRGTGGPNFVHLEPLVGLPQKQQTTTNSVYQAVQSGSAVGYLAYPNVPFPIWPAAELVKLRRVTLRSPTVTGTTETQFQIDWQYTFESNLELIGAPSSSA